MANNYALFSEMVSDIPPEGIAWLQDVLNMEPYDEDTLKKLTEELGVGEDAELDGWPSFNWELRPDSNELWLHSDEGFDEDHVCWLVRQLLKKFMPEYLFTMNVAHICDKPRLGEFGGSFIVIYKDHIKGDNTWDLSSRLEEELIAGEYDGEEDNDGQDATPT